jgi:cyclophilin family peptidyl-prolyl cis-trans isomerase
MLSPLLLLFAFLVVRAVTSGGDDKGDTEVAATDTKTAAPCPKKVDQTPVTNFKAAQRKCIDTGKKYIATITTDAGVIKIDLDAKRAPTTVNNFVVLARYHFYDGLTFHRAIPDFMIQGGDPQGTGQGGPGYDFPDESLEGTTYPAGSLAMANSGPNTNGSQFFIVATDAGGKSLQPNYTRFGTVIEGMDVVKKIVEDGGTQAGNGTDIKVKHKITTITIEES